MDRCIYQQWLRCLMTLLIQHTPLNIIPLHKPYSKALWLTPEMQYNAITGHNIQYSNLPICQ
jgi:hypothetical protein